MSPQGANFPTISGAEIDTSSTSLCEDCIRDIPQFKTALRNRKHLIRDERLTSRFWKEDGSPIACSLCRLLESSVRKPTGTDEAVVSDRPKEFSRLKEFSIVATSFLKSSREVSPAFHERFLNTDFTCLVVSRYMPLRADVEYNCIVETPAEDGNLYERPQGLGIVFKNFQTQWFGDGDVFVPQLVNPEKFNLHAVNLWLEICERRHGRFCQTGPRRLINGQAAQVERVSHNIVLIDCQARTLKESTTLEDFFALSYVWGSQSNLVSGRKLQINVPIPTLLPRTIEDAIRVVLLLERRYLWVDQLCIDQSSEEHKTSQIRIMDSIYGSAEVTIIAAAGEDAHFGLPGVSSIPRSTQMQLAVDDRFGLTVMPRRSDDVIHSSRWASRGWTYQEGILASRRLVFTEEQVYFECRSVWTQESIRRPLAVLVGRGQWNEASFQTSQRLRDGFRSGYFMSNCSNRPNFNRRKRLSAKLAFKDGIAAYHTRKLTYLGDFLNAFQGFLQTVLPGQNAWGLPLSLFSGGAMSLEDTLCWSLCWQHDQRSQPRRRQGLPSFSWTGWTGMPVFIFEKRHQIPVADFPGLEWDTLVVEPPPELIIEAKTSKVRLRYDLNGDLKPWNWSEGPADGAVWKTQLPGSGPAGNEAELSPMTLDILVLLLVHSGKTRHRLCGILYEKRDGFAERVGYFNIKTMSETDNTMDLFQSLLEEPLVTEMLRFR